MRTSGHCFERKRKSSHSASSRASGFCQAVGESPSWLAAAVTVLQPPKTCLARANNLIGRFLKNAVSSASGAKIFAGVRLKCIVEIRTDYWSAESTGRGEGA